MLSPPRPPTHLLRHSPDIGEALPEDNKDLPSPTAQCRGGTVEGSVPCSEHNHTAMKGGHLALTGTHTYKKRGGVGREGDRGISIDFWKTT